MAKCEVPIGESSSLADTADKFPPGQVKFGSTVFLQE
jgi:hypothetical protein